MIVYQTTSPEKHWLHCETTKKTIHINAAGARKVASVCSVEITRISTPEMNKIRGK